MPYTPLADGTHLALAIFSRAPAGYVTPDLDDWEDILNPSICMMHWVFGYRATADSETLKNLS
jgi:hypothetical protein